MPHNIDIAAHIGAVERKIESREHDGRPARVLYAKRTYNTTTDDVWDAITNPERIPRWFLPISGEFKLGGRYQFEGNAGGEITRCEPPELLGVTWEFGGQVSWLTVTLTATNNNDTRLVLEHIAHVPEEMWDQFGPGAVGVGWDGALLGLALHLASEAGLTPEEASAWQASPAGKQFHKLSSDEWCRASIAFGTDPDAARAAAERTTAFYTGTE